MFTVKNLLMLIGRNVLISLIAVTISTVGIIFLSEQIKHVSDSAALNHKLEATLRARSELFDVLKRNQQTIGANDVLIDNAYVSSDNILGFINAFDNLATQNNVTQIYGFETPAPSAISAPWAIATIAYSDNLEADVSTFSNYLKGFEKLPYFTKIDKFTISSQDKAGWVGVSAITFNATLYTKSTQ